MRFTERFPDVASLAAAEEDEVLKYWQGLGYYSRARNLHAAAKSIMERFNGVFPENYKEVLSLKGIGEYTANKRESTRYTFPSTTGHGWFQAKETIAAAVYSPIPFKDNTSL